MKKLIIILILALSETVSFAQDTAYISRDKTTALFFSSAVKIIGNRPAGLYVTQKEGGLITLKAVKADFSAAHINVQELRSAKIYHIPVDYCYGRAGRRIEIGEKAPKVAGIIKPIFYNDSAIVEELASGKRRDVIDREKTGRVKAWVSKLSLAGNRFFFRVDIRNKSSLPYEVDFIRFYIRDLKAVARMATQEREIVSVYSSFPKKTTITKKQEIAGVFSFPRFSLTEDQALNVEIYERKGNRNLNLKISAKDLDRIKSIPEKHSPGTVLVDSEAGILTAKH